LPPMYKNVFQHVLNHIHLQPKESHNVDFSRVRMWVLNGW
jgi:U3 small nucleolar RNA-associated protein 25